MTTKAKALHDFFNSFGVKAYVNTNVPDDVAFPYLTYQYAVNSFGDGDVPITVNLYYYTDSEQIPNEKAEEISLAIGRGGKTIPCDDGLIWIKKGLPFITSVVNEADQSIKQRYMNMYLEYLTY